MMKVMKPLIIDVREPDEFKSSHVEGALNIPVGDILNARKVLPGLPSEGHYVLYCQSGGRAGQAKAALERLGYTHIENGINQEHIEASWE